MVSKPDKLIDKETMTNILYDMALLEAIKYQYPFVVDSNEVNAPKYIYKKYKIDSLQFAQNNLYYASHFNEYKEMFAEIESRIKEQDSVLTKKISKKNKSNPKTTSEPTTEKVTESVIIPKKVDVDSVKRSIRQNREKLPSIE
ncbi:DUF4296 domain-containing protein [Flavobacterium sp. SE-1-e]|uniref:DUF4296 domain-containing protein n=1 Tax=Flavobacterium agrisoli TaxID=2793066 RepID=A0A934UKZ0_9FLAO|nr:DUF4296 domain-containing protein [Flavobacterium agrisoli]